MKKININVNEFIKNNKKKVCVATACTAATTLAIIATLNSMKKDK